MTDLVCVVGSLNDDTTLTVAKLPLPGETTLTEVERFTSPVARAPIRQPPLRS